MTELYLRLGGALILSTAFAIGLARCLAACSGPAEIRRDPDETRALIDAGAVDAPDFEDAPDAWDPCAPLAKEAPACIELERREGVSFHYESYAAGCPYPGPGCSIEGDPLHPLPSDPWCCAP